jgi:hypothetical protein
LRGEKEKERKKEENRYLLSVFCALLSPSSYGFVVEGGKRNERKYFYKNKSVIMPTTEKVLTGREREFN